MQMSSQLASLSHSGNFINSTMPAFALSTPFSPQPSSVRINALWSCSLVISLITASLGILVKQWFHEFMAQGTQDPTYRIRIRFFRSKGLERWQVFEIAAAGVDLNKLVIGKPAQAAGDANSGYIAPATLATCISDAHARGWSEYCRLAVM